MPYDRQTVRKILLQHQIRPSRQRLDIFEFMLHHQFHPTADLIYQALVKDYPSLSKTTIYNTLKTFLQAGIIRDITIDGDETRFDVVTENHGHFKCEHCGTIFNFRFDIDLTNIHDLDTFDVRDKQVYFKGTCPECLKKTQDR